MPLVRGKRRDAPAVGFAQLGRGATMRGEAQGSGLFVLHGAFDGSIDLHGDLIVAEGAEASLAEGRALRLRVEGRVRGSVRVQGGIEVSSGGKLAGTVEARALKTAPGGSCRGALRIGRRG